MFERVQKYVSCGAAVLLATALAACGGATPAPTSAPAATSTTSVTDTPAAAVTNTLAAAATDTPAAAAVATDTAAVTNTVAAAATDTPAAAATAAITATESPTSSMPSANTTLTEVQTSSLGYILADGAGRTVYMFKKDTPGTSACTGACVDTWPPLTVTQGMQPVLGPDLSGNIGTLARADSTTQVTYSNMPLYYFKGDAKPGDTNGQGIGNNWYVIPVTPTMTSGSVMTATATP